jgi:hypothetical protein
MGGGAPSFVLVGLGEMHFLHAHEQQEREVEVSSGPEQHC